MFSLPRGQVQSLIVELRSHKLHSVAGGKKKSKTCFTEDTVEAIKRHLRLREKSLQLVSDERLVPRMYIHG